MANDGASADKSATLNHGVINNTTSAFQLMGEPGMCKASLVFPDTLYFTVLFFGHPAQSTEAPMATARMAARLLARETA